MEKNRENIRRTKDEGKYIFIAYLVGGTGSNQVISVEKEYTSSDIFDISAILDIVVNANYTLLSKSDLKKP
jgi:hypothetical protein